MPVDKVKTINELERVPNLSDSNAFAISTGAATWSVTLLQIEQYLEQYLEQLANKVDTVKGNYSSVKYPSVKALVDAMNEGAPAGLVSMWPIATIPDGWLWCDGSAVSRNTYANLYKRIGTRYGAGDGSTTFNLPDLRNRTIWQANTKDAAGTYNAGGVPDHNHSYTANSSHGRNGQATVPWWSDGDSSNGVSTGVFTNASASNAAYGRNGDLVVPTSLTINFIIKY